MEETKLCYKHLFPEPVITQYVLLLLFYWKIISFMVIRREEERFTIADMKVFMMGSQGSSHQFSLRLPVDCIITKNEQEMAMLGI